MATQSKDKAVTARTETGEVVEIPKWLAVFPIAETDDDVQERIAQQILASETVDQVLSGLPDTVGLRDLIGEELVITDVRLRPSDQENSLGAYALVAYKRAGEDEEGIFTTGSVNVLAQLVRIHTLGGFPFKCTAYETVSKSNPKNKPLWLRAVGAF